MTEACVSTGELARLVDGELTENRAREMRDHLAQCTACSAELARWHALAADVAAPVAPPAGARERVVARLTQLGEGRGGGSALLPRRTRRRAAMAITAGALTAAVAAAAAVAIWVRAPGDRDRDRNAFVARGGSGHSIARDVDVSLYAAGDALVRLRSGDAVTAATPIAVAYRNLGGPAFAMVFARDAAGELHWVMPAYLDAHSDPESFAVEPSTALRVLPQATVLEAPAAGHLVVVVAVTASPHRVSEIEAVPEAERGEPAALQRRWPDADVRVIDLDVRPAAGDPSHGATP